jgi:hypothetical protein
MMATSLVDRVGFGVAVDDTAVTDGSATLGTTAVEVTLPDVTAGGGGNGYIKVKLVNLSASATIGWKMVPRGAAAPTISTTPASGMASPILPNVTEYITIPTSCDLYVVASAAATSWSSTAQLIR